MNRFSNARAMVLAAAIVALALIGTGSLFAQSLIRGPYLQDLRPNSVMIVWVTDIACDSQVDYGLSAPYTQAATDASLVTQHAVTLTGLAMGTIYHYQVKSGGVTLTGDLTFHSGKDSTFNSFMYVAMGDHRSQPAQHASVAQRVAIIDPEFVVDAGDLTADGNNASLWDTEFFTPEQNVMKRSCLFPSIGNHEGTAANYMAYFYLPTDSSGTERYYSFDYANAHFILLDNYSTYTAGSPQYNWLVSDLAANQNKMWIFVTMHWSPYSSGSHGNNTTAQAALVPLFLQYGVDVVFCGHDHSYERLYVNGIYYIVTGAGGAPLYVIGSGPYTQFSASAYECCKATVNNNVLTVDTIEPNGNVLDSFSVTQVSAADDWSLY